jgi:PBP1b-binding outer membrane lipoprotein LpoB
MKFSKLFILPALLCAVALTACSNPKVEAESVGDKPTQEAVTPPDAAEQARIDQMIKAIQAEEARMKVAGETK